MLVVDDRNPDPYRNLILATEAHIQLVAVRGEPLYGDRQLLALARGSEEGMETTWTLRKGGRSKAMMPNCPNTGLPAQSVAETAARLQQGLRFDARQLADKLTPQQRAKDFAQCGLSAPDASTPVTAVDAKRLLACRYSLPFERTRLSPLTMGQDPDFLPRLMRNPNLPKYLRKLPTYYR